MTDSHLDNLTAAMDAFERLARVLTAADGPEHIRTAFADVTATVNAYRQERGLPPLPPLTPTVVDWQSIALRVFRADGNCFLLNDPERDALVELHESTPPTPGHAAVKLQHELIAGIQGLTD